MTLQLQLPLWFNKYNVNNLKESNKVLQKYYNTKQKHIKIKTTPYAKFYSFKAIKKFENVENLNLDKIFSLKFERIAFKDDPIKFKSLTIRRGKN